MQSKINIGKIVNFHGTQGNIKLLSNSDFKNQRFLKNNTFYIQVEDKFIKVTLEKYKNNITYDILKFKEFNSINEVLPLKNCNLYSLEKIPLKENEYYYEDIYKCRIYHKKSFLGYVYKIVDIGYYDLWYIKKYNNKDLILPFKDEFIKDINILKRVIVVHNIESLLEL